MMPGHAGRPARRRARRRRPLAPLALGVVFAILLLLVGISVGRALEDGPEPGGTQTSIRTLDPRPLPPAGSTVTITVTE